jgi:chitinase
VVIGVGTLIYSHAESITATLSLSPSSQTVTNGSDVTITLSVNPDGNSVNTIQTVLTYPSANFSLVSAVGGSSFGNFVDTPTTGSLSITAASTSAVTSTTPITVATITLLANANGSNLPVSLSSVCPAGNYGITCSAVYNSTSSNNDLSSVGSAASYTVNPLPPNAPTNLTSSAITSTSTGLSWTASTDTNGTVGGYYVYRYVTSAGSSTATKIATLTAPTTSYTSRYRL